MIAMMWLLCVILTCHQLTDAAILRTNRKFTSFKCDHVMVMHASLTAISRQRNDAAVVRASLILQLHQCLIDGFKRRKAVHAQGYA
jgi:hypothetical protein